MKLTGKLPQLSLNCLKVLEELVGPVAGVKPALAMGPMPFCGHRPQIDVEHFRGSSGEGLAPWVILHR